MVIWGGPHCVAAPELSLHHADGVCFAEGDIAVPEFAKRLASGGDYLGTPNMAFRVNGKNILNKRLPPFSDLDSLPHSDFDVKNMYKLGDLGLEPLTIETLRVHFPKYPSGKPSLSILTSRGCNDDCNYRHNIGSHQMHGLSPVRYRSVETIIDELASISIKRRGVPRWIMLLLAAKPVRKIMSIVPWSGWIWFLRKLGVHQGGNLQRPDLTNRQTSG